MKRRRTRSPQGRNTALWVGVGFTAVGALLGAVGGYQQASKPGATYVGGPAGEALVGGLAAGGMFAAVAGAVGALAGGPGTAERSLALGGLVAFAGAVIFDVSANLFAAPPSAVLTNPTPTTGVNGPQLYSGVNP